MQEQRFVDEAQSLLECTAKALVDKSEDVIVTLTSGNPTGGGTKIFGLRCNKQDLGKLIGKMGRTATAIRTILNAVAAKHNCRVVLDIDED